MKSQSDRVLGIILMLVGVVIGVEVLGQLEIFSVGLRNGWILLIIVPCVLDVSKRGINRMNFIWLGLGLTLFLTGQFAVLSGMFWPFMFIIFGLMFILIPSN